MQNMRPFHSRMLIIAGALALLLASGDARAQIGGPLPGTSLGVPGTGSSVGGTGIPIGATELGSTGLSPAPLSAIPGITPTSPSMPSATMPSTSTTPSFGSGLSPGVSPPGGYGPSPPSFGITNFGVGGTQALPGSPRSGRGGTDR
jgi:hypothetical protein